MGLNEKGRSGGVPVRPLLNSYLNASRLDTVNLPTFWIFYLEWIQSLARNFDDQGA
jgi:hypothetical protein